MSAAGAPPLVLSVFSTFAIGGPQVRFATLANRLGPAFRHAIVAMDGDLGCAERLAPGLDIAWPEVAIRKGDTFGNAWRFRRALRRIRPDVLVTYNWGTIEWALANAWPLARHVHVEDGFGPEEQSAQLPRRVLMRRAFLRRRTVVVPSRTLWRIATEVWRLPEARLRYIPNGIDLARFAPAAERAAGQPVTIGTVAALRSEKNLARLLRAFRLLPEEGGARLVIAGEGPERASLEALAVALGLGGRVRFTGHVGDPAPLYRTFDLFALSSDTEQMPLSVLEAMAAGLPVVATDVGDVRAMLAAENAPFVTTRDEAGLAEGLRRLAEDAPLRARIGAANRARAEREYDERAMVGAYAALFAESEQAG
ncbi:glycosyltransferase family 4 protein [Crenalkalicoccus roseus]|uniref:glycosyltransferase family 4 protein n=1 Tax=Crenalkalicoccus roseus TaxID=1485588 RepID=UPI001080A5D6|nr:glycosyltransferase family 4 protein [Crenalkalicoccus roseus]